MSKNLVIVESPSKAKTIGKFLGGHYKVMASVGHVRDLPKSKLGIDVETYKQYEASGKDIPISVIYQISKKFPKKA